MAPDTAWPSALLLDLQQLGFAADPSELATAPLAARSWLERKQRRPLALVHPAIAPLFANSSGEPPDCVLLGDGRDLLSYANLNAALELLMQGAPLIGIGRNRRFREAGRWMLDAGAFLQALEYGADCTALVLGKPSAAFFAEVVRSLGLPADACLMVGDDVEADVCGAAAAGLTAWLVQTGKYRHGDEDRLPRGCTVISGIGALPEWLGSPQGDELNLLAAQLDLKRIPRQQAEHRGVGRAHHQVAVELHLGAVAELAARLAAATATATATAITQLLDSGEQIRFGEHDLKMHSLYLHTKEVLFNVRLIRSQDQRF